MIIFSEMLVRSQPKESEFIVLKFVFSPKREMPMRFTRRYCRMYGFLRYSNNPPNREAGLLRRTSSYSRLAFIPQRIDTSNDSSTVEHRPDVGRLGDRRKEIIWYHRKVWFDSNSDSSTDELYCLY